MVMKNASQDKYKTSKIIRHDTHDVTDLDVSVLVVIVLASSREQE